MKLYFAAPLFSQAEREFNAQLAERFETAGITVYLPQRDGAEPDIPPYNTMTPAERFPLIFQKDRDEVFASDVALFILDGRVPDEGVCVELGLAYADKYERTANRLLIGLLTDNHFTDPIDELNPMIGMALDHIFQTDQAVIDFLVAGAPNANSPGSSPTSI